MDADVRQGIIFPEDYVYTGGNEPFVETWMDLPGNFRQFSEDFPRTIIGQAPEGDYTLQLIVTDFDGDSDSLNIPLSIGPLSRPMFQQDLPDIRVTINVEIEPITLPEATGGTGNLTYSVTGLPAGLMFGAVTRTITGTPTELGLSEIRYRVTDSNPMVPEIGERRFNIVVVEGEGPFLTNTVSDQSYLVNSNVSLELPSAIGVHTPFTYTVENLPTGLSFDASTRTISGVPTEIGSTGVVYEVTDNVDERFGVIFDIHIVPFLDTDRIGFLLRRANPPSWLTSQRRATFSDISASVVGFVSTFHREKEFGNHPISSLTVYLDNSNGEFDGVESVTQTNVFSLTLFYGGEGFSRFYGIVRRARKTYKDGNSVVEVVLTDITTKMRHVPQFQAVGLLGVGTFIANVLDTIGFDEDYTDIRFSNTQILSPPVFAARVALDDIQRAANSDGGLFYAHGSGRLTFVPRRILLTNRAAIPTITIGPQHAPTRDFYSSVDTELIVNRVVLRTVIIPLTRPGQATPDPENSPPIIIENDDSIARYSQQTQEIATFILGGNTPEGQSLADYIFSIKGIDRSIENVVLDVQSLSEDEQKAILGADPTIPIGVRLERDQINANFFIENYTLEYSNDSATGDTWTCTMDLFRG